MALGHVTWSAACRRRCARNWYRAHNASIVGAYLKRQRLAEAETAPERFFMNVALARVLQKPTPSPSTVFARSPSLHRHSLKIPGVLLFLHFGFLSRELCPIF